MLRGQGLAPVEALAVVAPQALQLGKLVRVRDTFRRRLDAKRVGERHDRLHDRPVAGCRRDAGHEGSVDLEHIHRKAAQVQQ